MKLFAQPAYSFISSGCFNMKFRRCIWAVLTAALLFGSLGVAEVNAYGPRRGYAAPAMAYYPPVGGYGMYYPMYVAPLPGYGILPPPLAMMNWYGYDSQPNVWGRTAEDYGYRSDQFDGAPRKRAALYPAVPFEKSPEERLADVRRMRYEITVPFADAVVLIDGVKTKQTGLTRVFVTPPMQEEKEYTVTITVQWTDQDGTPRTRAKTFTVLAGGTVRHTFIE